jgi:hypothetical protein
MYYIRKEEFHPNMVADADSLMSEFNRADAHLTTVDQNNFIDMSITTNSVVMPKASPRGVTFTHDPNSPALTGGFLGNDNDYSSLANNRLDVYNYGADSYADWIADQGKWFDLDINIEFTSHEYMPIIVMLVVQHSSTVASDAGRALVIDTRVLLDGDPQGCTYTATACGDGGTSTPVRVNSGFMTTLMSAPGPHVLSAQVRDRSGVTPGSSLSNHYTAADHSFMKAFGIAR